MSMPTMKFPMTLCGSSVKILLLFVFVAIFFAVYSCGSKEAKSHDFNFEGEIEKIEYGSPRDSSDSITISGRRVFLFEGMASRNKKPVGKIIGVDGRELSMRDLFNNEAEFIGKKAEVFCERYFYGREQWESLSLIGKKTYYIRIED